MANKMLIDASHPEETRVVVLRGNRVEEFDFESASKKQLRGNIYLAKVTRVEPSLQAAFVDYGGNRHGFLAFSEIHPDYYQIPVVDRQALIEEEALAHRDEDEEDSRAQRRSRRSRRGDRNGRRAEKRRDDDTVSEAYEGETAPREAVEGALFEPREGEADEAGSATAIFPSVTSEAGPDQAWSSPEPEQAERAPGGEEEDEPRGDALEAAVEPSADFGEEASAPAFDEFGPDQGFASGPSDIFQDEKSAPENMDSRDEPESRRPDDADDEGDDEEEQVEQLGGDAMEDVPSRPHQHRKQYKIQEVIKRRQVLLVQVVKEERGNKGAALTTYLSLAGRYSVLMPNTARGGGISRKITDSTDRQRLKSIAQELEVPEGMGVILRTAGALRTKAEVKRDFEYLLRMWETVRETTLSSTAPTLVYEEGSLIKRSIRDLFNKDIDEILVAGDAGYREAKEFMRLLMPSHAKSVQPYRDPQPMFAKSGAEAQLDAMFSNQVTLKSGGYIVINQTEALVAIDVNSGRSTREHNIEDTALRTNLEAVDEIARQLRLRDLAGLIVLDLIDMEEGRNNRAVERRLKDALKNDRARIQIGRISHFGLLEMSRQRIRTGVLEGSTVICPHCAGAGMLRSTSSIALHVLRILEDALIKSASYDIIVKTQTIVALYILNQKRSHLHELEGRFGVAVTIAADDSLTGATYYALERGEPAAGLSATPALALSDFRQAPLGPAADVAFAPFEDEDETDSAAEMDLADGESDDSFDVAKTPTGDGQDGDSEADGRRKRRRRRRRGRGADREGSGIAANAPQPPDDALEAIARIGELQPAPIREAVEIEGEAEAEPAPPTASPEPEDAAPSGRRRPRRGERSVRVAEESAAAPKELEPELALDIAPPTALEQELPAAEATEASAAEGLEAPAAEAADMESAPQKPARRARRTPRPRSPRRAAVASETEAAPESHADVEVAAAAQEPAEPVAAHGGEIAPLPDDAQFGAGEAPSFAKTSPPAEPQPPVPQDPARPKRSGWWQRAKASLKG
jgi:ribonuclease E